MACDSATMPFIQNGDGNGLMKTPTKVNCAHIGFRLHAIRTLYVYRMFLLEMRKTKHKHT